MPAICRKFVSTRFHRLPVFRDGRHVLLVGLCTLHRPFGVLNLEIGNRNSIPRGKLLNLKNIVHFDSSIRRVVSRFARSKISEFRLILFCWHYSTRASGLRLRLDITFSMLAARPASEASCIYINSYIYQ
jgi:hypothetical protein